MSTELFIPQTFTVSTGTYTGGTGNIFLRKTDGWIELIIMQNTLGSGSGYENVPISAIGVLPVGYRPTNILQYPCPNLTRSNIGTIFINPNGDIDMLTYLGWQTDTECGLVNSFSCRFHNTQ